MHKGTQCETERIRTARLPPLLFAQSLHFVSQVYDFRGLVDKVLCEELRAGDSEGGGGRGGKEA
jgi:hypothetical protein